MARLRPYLLGILGLAAITFPFLWLQLQPDFTNNTLKVAWAPAHGLQFFDDLLPVFVVAFLIWIGIRANRYWNIDDALAKNPAWLKAGAIWESAWAWIAMPLVLSAPFFCSASTTGLFTNVGIYMLLALGLNITVGMTGLLVLGYAGFFAFGAYFFALGQQSIPFFPARRIGGIFARSALPAPAWRLPRHRHARLRGGLSRNHPQPRCGGRRSGHHHQGLCLVPPHARY
jgi:hypothetical protein